MIKKTFKYPIALLSCLLIIASCKKDGVDLSYFKVYANAQVNSAAISDSVISTGLVFIGDSLYGEKRILLSSLANVTRTAPEDINSQFTVDTFLVSAYNLQNNTKYNTLPDSVFSIGNNGKVSIKKGNVASLDSVVLQLKMSKQLISNNSYLLPLVLSSADKNNTNLFSANRNTIYLIIQVQQMGIALKTGSSAAVGVASISYYASPIQNNYPTYTSSFTLYSNVASAGNFKFLLEPRSSLVDAYNQKNGTTYQSMPSNAFTFTADTTFLFYGTKTSSSAFSVKLDTTKLTSKTTPYLLPIGIKGLGNTDSTIMYLTVSPLNQNIDPLNTGLTGTNIDRTGWVATASSNNSSTYTPAKMLDGVNTTSWISGSGSSNWFQVDMGISNTVKGFFLTPNYNLTPSKNNFTQLNVYSSADNVNWTYQGNYVNTLPSSSSTASNPDIKTMKFYNPVTARYFKFNIVTTANSGLAELVGVQ